MSTIYVGRNNGPYKNIYKDVATTTISFVVPAAGGVAVFAQTTAYSGKAGPRDVDVVFKLFVNNAEVDSVSSKIHFAGPGRGTVPMVTLRAAGQNPGDAVKVTIDSNPTGDIVENEDYFSITVIEIDQII